MNINSNTYKWILYTATLNCYYSINYTQIKGRNVKRKNVQTGKGVNVFVMANRLGTVIESRYKIGEIKPSLFVKKFFTFF